MKWKVMWEISLNFYQKIESCPLKWQELKFQFLTKAQRSCRKWRDDGWTWLMLITQTNHITSSITIYLPWALQYAVIYQLEYIIKITNCVPTIHRADNSLSKLKVISFQVDEVYRICWCGSKYTCQLGKAYFSTFRGVLVS